jgi:acetyl-CoA synthetase
MLPKNLDYDALCTSFRWPEETQFNIGFDICDRHCAQGRGAQTAILSEQTDGALDRWTFDALKEKSDRLAAALAQRGVGRGDRVAILMPQAVETALAHIATYKLGAIAVPLFTLFGADALAYRLGDCGARALVVGAADAERVSALLPDLPALETILCVSDQTPAPLGEGFWQAIDSAPDGFACAQTGPDDPAVIIYTSGTTGKPKGALHGHRVLWGHLPGVELPQNLFPQDGDLFWTPADWAWIGGLLDVLLPALHHGVPVLAKRFAKFTPEDAFDLMARHGVRNAFMPPTALKLMRGVKDVRQRWPALALRSIGSGGETLGADLIAWGQDTFGVTINEFYGQTECNLVVGNCADLFPVRPGAMGKAIPGHHVAVIDGLTGERKAVDQEGAIAVLAPDPVMFLHYWNKPEATAEKFVTGPEGRWLLTGDLGRQDADGYFWFLGRDDDVITSAGYRIGPAEVEEALMRHPAVTMAAAVGVPDPLRTEAVKAFVVLAPEAQPTDQAAAEALAAEIQTFVKTRMAAHAYPRSVVFVDSLPMTPTGKIRRRDLRDC